MVEANTTYIKFEQQKFPLWNVNEHLDYLSEFDFTDLMICSGQAGELLEFKLANYINYAAGIGWSHIKMTPRLFDYGYSKIFLGGSNRLLPNKEEYKKFCELLKVYGSSSFGLNVHLTDKEQIKQINALLDHFSEINIIDQFLQLTFDKAAANNLVTKFDSFATPSNNEFNLIAPKKTWEFINKKSKINLNYVNYCEHGIGTTVKCNAQNV